MSMTNDTETPRTALIKENLRRSFQDKANEDLPDELMSLISKLRDQDDSTANG